MSRVFEALTKASEEKKRQADTPHGEREPVVTEAIPLETPGPNLEWHLGPNGNQGPNGKHHEIPRPLLAKTAVPKSWRERVEELFFGWDLRRYGSYPIVTLEKDSPVSEQYKILREQLKRLRTESGIRTFSITSPLKRDGKTIVAVNLAAALALDYEEKVLLIDGDLRAPSVHRYFNTQGSPGLSDYLGSNSNRGVRTLVRETFLDGLLILPAGRPSGLPSELLAKEKMKNVMEEIQSEFPEHLIIFDSPPILSTPDPMVLARQVDGVLMVVRAGKTPRDYLTKALRSLNSSKVMGIVLNGADLGIASKHYYYYSTNGTH